jgi:hypothetical protein
MLETRTQLVDLLNAHNSDKLDHQSIEPQKVSEPDRDRLNE